MHCLFRPKQKGITFSSSSYFCLIPITEALKKHGLKDYQVSITIEYDLKSCRKDERLLEPLNFIRDNDQFTCLQYELINLSGYETYVIKDKTINEIDSMTKDLMDPNYINTDSIDCFSGKPY